MCVCGSVSVLFSLVGCVAVIFRAHMCISEAACGGGHGGLPADAEARILTVHTLHVKTLAYEARKP